MKMLVMGAPGSGKGKQSEVLSEKFDIPAISTGAILRNAIIEGTETGVTAAKYINDGKLVPDEVMIGIVMERLNQDDCANGYILDGFPRTLAQAKAMERAGIKVDTVLFIDVTDEVVISRLCGRRVCQCGAVYHIEAKPSAKGELCELCSAPLTVRDDDTSETVADRLKIYHEQTKPVIKYYEESGRLVSAKSQDSVSETTKAVLLALKKA